MTSSSCFEHILISGSSALVIRDSDHQMARGGLQTATSPVQRSTKLQERFRNQLAYPEKGHRIQARFFRHDIGAMDPSPKFSPLYLLPSRVTCQLPFPGSSSQGKRFPRDYVAIVFLRLHALRRGVACKEGKVPWTWITTSCRWSPLCSKRRQRENSNGSWSEALVTVAVMHGILSQYGMLSHPKSLTLRSPRQYLGGWYMTLLDCI